MEIKKWESRYREIIEEFGYLEKDDMQSAKKLDSILGQTYDIDKIRKSISQKTVFVIGAGPTLDSVIPVLKKFKYVIIAADGATKALIENDIIPDFVVTDLDGNLESLVSADKQGAVMIVHAHGDNKEKLEIVRNFQNCIGTTQTKPFGKLYNFGGFTDGDRSVFLADHFGARRIILFAMDFGNIIGRYSKEGIVNYETKIRKMKYATKLLEWISKDSDSELYTVSNPIKGFIKIDVDEIDNIITNENAF